MAVVKIRVCGTMQECGQAVRVLEKAFDVRESSGFYPNRGSSILGRVYIDAELPALAKYVPPTVEIIRG